MSRSCRVVLVVSLLLLLTMGSGAVAVEPAATTDSSVPVISTSVTEFDAVAAERFARLALECADKEYPNKIAHVMQSDDDLGLPRQFTPSFFGCFDWHSSVHGHWLLARLARQFPEAEFARKARWLLDDHLIPLNIAREVAYISGEGRTTFERPYGLAWLLQLAAELREWEHPDTERMTRALAPLEQLAAERLLSWLPKLRYPIRTGEHSQTAFAFGLALDWARTVGNDSLAALIESKTLEFHRKDRGCNLAFEPSGQDFLSPCIAEADLMRRVLPPAEFGAWLKDFLPEIPWDGSTAWLPVAEVTDRSDGKLAHLDGLNLSRAWMLEGIAAGLPEFDARRESLLMAAREHREVGLAAVTGEFYEGGHWLGSFATYLVTGRGLPR
ncbi:MAG: DUF2891 domain-containing protein [bacterium]